MIEGEDVAALCFRLGMSDKDVWQLRKEFNDEDTDNTCVSGSNSVPHETCSSNCSYAIFTLSSAITSFFYLIHEEKRALTVGLLRLAGLTSPTQTRLSFDQFLRCVATFATFTEGEVLHFFFQVYSNNTGGGLGVSGSKGATMAESDLMKLGQDLQVLRTAFAGNIQVATTNGGTAESWTVSDFERFSRQHAVAFYPLIQIQRNVRLAGVLERCTGFRRCTRNSFLPTC